MKRKVGIEYLIDGGLKQQSRAMHKLHHQHISAVQGSEQKTDSLADPSVKVLY